MLITLGLKEKQVMLLVSSQLIQICDDLFELRQDAANVDTSNKGLTAVRFAWVTLRSLNKMAEYLQDKFKMSLQARLSAFLRRKLLTSILLGVGRKRQRPWTRRLRQWGIASPR